MFKSLLNPKKSVKAAPIAGLCILAVGGLVGAQSMAEAIDKNQGIEKAHQRYENCILIEGAIIPGQYYSQTLLVDGGKKQQESLIADGQPICDIKSSTAQISGGVAGYIRHGKPDEVKKILETRFGVANDDGKIHLEIPAELKGGIAKAWKADPSKRGPITFHKKPNFWQGLFSAPKK
jgi:hypothetical protein